MENIIFGFGFIVLLFGMLIAINDRQEIKERLSKIEELLMADSKDKEE